MQKAALSWLPIVGHTTLHVEDMPIDCGATVGMLCQIRKQDGAVYDVYGMAKARAHFGIYAGWNQDVCYVACAN